MTPRVILLILAMLCSVGCGRGEKTVAERARDYANEKMGEGKEKQPNENVRYVENYVKAYRAYSQHEDPAIYQNQNLRPYFLDENYTKQARRIFEGLLIVGGESIKLNTESELQPFPDCVALGTKNTDGTFAFYASGVMYNSNTIITAVHLPNPTVVYFNNDPDPSKISEKYIFEVCPNQPAFCYTPSRGLRLLKLKQDVPQRFQAVPIAADGDLTMTAEYTAVGYGRTETNVATGKLERKNWARVVRISDDSLMPCQFIIGGLTTAFATDPCPGDSGGPVYVKTDSGLRLAGIIDGNISACGSGTICNRLTYDKYLNWLQTPTTTNSPLSTCP